MLRNIAVNHMALLLLSNWWDHEFPGTLEPSSELIYLQMSVLGFSSRKCPFAPSKRE